MFNVSVTSPVYVNRDIFKKWLAGKSVEETTRYELAKISTRSPDVREYMKSEIQQQYRNFYLLSYYLCEPIYLCTQSLFQLSPSNQYYLIHSYYEFDDRVFRIVIGKKLSNARGKKIENTVVAYIHNLSQYRYKIQFENLRRVLRKVEDMIDTSLQTNIEKHFLISPELAVRYARIIFLCNNRLECTAKKLSFIELKDFEYCAGLMIKHWTINRSIVLDKELFKPLDHIRDVILEKQTLDRFRALAVQESELYEMNGLSAEIKPLLPKILKQLIRFSFSLTADFAKSKQARRFFLEFFDKTIFLLVTNNVKVDEVRILYACILTSFQKLIYTDDRLLAKSRMLVSRIIKVLDPCTQRLLSLRYSVSPNIRLGFSA